jgi:WD40 repeat protein
MTASRLLVTCFAAAAFALSGCDDKPTKPNVDTTGYKDPDTADPGAALFNYAEYKPAATVSGGSEPITVPLANVVVTRKLDLPSKVDGTILWIGTEIDEAAAGMLNPHDVFHHPRDNKIYRRLTPGDYVKRDQVVVLLDDKDAFYEFKAAQTKLAAAKASVIEYDKTVTQLRLLRDQVKQGEERGVVPTQELYTQEATLARYNADSADRRGQADVASAEAEKAQNLLNKHTLSSMIEGEVQQVIKHEGDGVKGTEPMLTIHDFGKLRVVGSLPKEYLNIVSAGNDVTIEVPRDVPYGVTFDQHTTNKPIVAVAVAVVGGKPVIVSAAEDGWVYAWDRELKVLGSVRIAGGVRSLAVTRPGVDPALALVGGADGTARLYDAANLHEVRSFDGKHEGGVSAAAFSPDGRYCVTSDERGIYMNEVASGKRLYTFPVREHHSPITSLSFTPQGRVISAGREPSVRVWVVGKDGARVEHRIDSRSGDVQTLGVTDDGSRLLLDADKTHLDVIHLQELRKERPLLTAGEAGRFTTFTAVSPELGKKADNRVIATTGGTEGVVQLWRAPTAETRGAEIARFVTRGAAAATCAAFSPLGEDGFLVVGTRKGDVHLWPLPAADVQAQLGTTVTYVEQSIESSGRTVNVLVDFDNPKSPEGRYLLRPGTAVTLVIRPKK